MGAFWSYFLDFFGLGWVLSQPEQQARLALARPAVQSVPRTRQSGR